MTTKINGTTGVTAAKFTAGDATSVGSFGRCIIRDQQNATVVGGASAVGYNIRTLNTLLVNDIGVTLSSNAFTLQPGTYLIEGSAPAYMCDLHKCFIALAASPTVPVLVGTAEYAHSGTGEVPSNRSFISGRLVVTSASAYILGHYCSKARTPNGFGVPTGVLTEVYSTLTITKEA